MGSVYQLKWLMFFMLLMTVSFAEAQIYTQIELNYQQNPELKGKIENNTVRLINEFNACFISGSSLSLDDIHLTETAKNRIHVIWENSPFTCTESKLSLNLLKRAPAGYELRNIPISVKCQGKTDSEELVVSYTPSGMIEDISFALEYHHYKKLMNNQLPVKELRRRQMILNFVENYRTAYNRKDIDFLDKVFSEHALIIVGRVVENDPLQKEVRMNDKKKVDFVKLNKQQYMSNLKSLFQTNKQVRVNFEEIDISISPKNPNIYGVKMLQYWRSGTYADKGYLFLMIDFSNETEPKIYVRSWQPEKETREEEVLDLGDFVIEG